MSENPTISNRVTVKHQSAHKQLKTQHVRDMRTTCVVHNVMDIQDELLQILLKTVFYTAMTLEV